MCLCPYVFVAFEIESVTSTRGVCLHREHVWVMCVPLMLLCAYKYVEEHFIFMIKHMLLAEKCSNDLK